MKTFIQETFGYDTWRFIENYGPKALLVMALMLAVYILRSYIVKLLKDVGAKGWMRIGFANTKETKSFSRKIGLYKKDSETEKEEYVEYHRPLFKNEIRVRCSKTVTPTMIKEKSNQISHYFFRDETEIAYIESERDIVRMLTHSEFPEELFEESIEDVDKAVAKKSYRVPLYQGRNPCGIIITEGDDKSCSIAVGAPGSGKSMSLEAVYFSIQRYDSGARIYIFDSSELDFAHLSADNVFMLKSEEDLLNAIREIKEECRLRKEKMLALIREKKVKVSNRATFEKLTGTRLQTLVLIIDEAQLVFDKSAPKNSSQEKIIQEYRELTTKFRKFGFISFLASPESKASDLAISFNAVASRVAGELPFAETSKTFLGSEIACNSRLRRGRLVVKVPGEAGELSSRGIVTQFPKAFKSIK